MTLDIRIAAHSDPARAAACLAQPLAFGRSFADLMVTIRCAADRGWHDAAVVPFAPLRLSPAAKVLHYSQEIFEGHKAYRWPSGQVALFRPELNARRLNRSARRMCLPEIPVELQLSAIDTLTHLLRAWVPGQPATSLYLRPAIIGTEGALGVSPSAEHLYFVIASPVGPYFPACACVSILVEQEQVRAACGGVGAAKTGGNYAAGLDAQRRATEQGFDQVLWLDAAERRYVEELGAMNVFAVVDGVLVTPPLGGTILPGITRQSLLELAPELGLAAREQPLPIDELVAGLGSGSVSELFAVGTAAVVTPVGALGYRGKRHVVGAGKPGPIVERVRRAITDLQHGRAPDRRGWMHVVNGPAKPAGSLDEQTVAVA